MKCVLVFDGLNDIIFSKYNKEFLNHVNAYAKAHGLISEHNVKDDEKLSSNVIVQIFSPLVTSHRIMGCEFGNTYSSIECEDGINLVFHEYMGHLFVTIGKERPSNLKIYQRICIAIVRSVCSANIKLLKRDSYSNLLVCNLLDSWERLCVVDQAVKVEAVEQLTVNAYLSSVTLEALKEAVNKLKFPKVHAMIMVQNKFLSLYSSQNAKELSSVDILLLTMLNNMKKAEIPTSNFHHDTEISSDELFFSTQSEASMQYTLDVESVNIDSYCINLAGCKVDPVCVPYAVHIVPLSDDVRLLIMVEFITTAKICIRIYEIFLHLNIFESLQVQKDAEAMKQALQNLELAVTRLSDGVRHLKIEKADMKIKMIISKWKEVKKIYQELIKVYAEETQFKAESLLSGFADMLKMLFDLTKWDYSFLNISRRFAYKVAEGVVTKLAAFNDIFKVKAMKNFSLGSYLKEFPGLIHFIYVDRTTHRIIAPSLDINPEADANTDFRTEIWQMIEFSRQHLEEGHLSILWKDSNFAFAYFLWFEDSAGNPIKPTNTLSDVIKKFPQSGIMNGDFYYKLKQHCFPKLAPHKVKCFELYSAHLKIVAPPLILEHMRRLIATIWEIKGYSNHPMDLI